MLYKKIHTVNLKSQTHSSYSSSPSIQQPFSLSSSPLALSSSLLPFPSTPPHTQTHTTSQVCESHNSMSTYLIVHLPRLVAKMTMGAMVDSRARCRYVKHSMSSMCTSSMNSTPGTSSAMPWSMYLLTTLLISLRNLSTQPQAHRPPQSLNQTNCNSGVDVILSCFAILNSSQKVKHLSFETHCEVFNKELTVDSIQPC